MARPDGPETAPGHGRPGETGEDLRWSWQTSPPGRRSQGAEVARRIGQDALRLGVHRYFQARFCSPPTPEAIGGDSGDRQVLTVAVHSQLTQSEVISSEQHTRMCRVTGSNVGPPGRVGGSGFQPAGKIAHRCAD